jgi:hypothetical protein
MKLNILAFFLFFYTTSFWAQNANYAVSTIPDSLKLNANSVIRFHEININVASRNEMIVKSIQATTVLNELGLNNLDLAEGYDKSKSINKIEVVIYDASGNVFKKFKRKDFKDQSAVESGTVFSDSRVLYLNYTPTVFPFTIVFEVETKSSNTAFLPTWNAIDGYLVSTQLASIEINYSPELNLNKKEINFSDSYHIVKNETENSIKYTVVNLPAKKHEELAPSFEMLFPRVMFGLESFSLEGLVGNAKSWKEMGKWFYDEILEGTTDLPNETVAKMRNLVGSESDPMKVAEVIYKYVQEKTRYVSIQEGIGGWKPMLASEVDKLGYGDCKALTNYTRALLKAVGVNSYYSRLYGQPNKREIFTDIVSFQSNHVILAIPYKTNYIWLECTSQIQPFGFQGDFTDDRSAYVIKPDGGEIVKTKTYSELDNLKFIKGSFKINDNGDFIGKVKIDSKGLVYESAFRKERTSQENQIKFYKEEFDNINNLSVKKINLNNNPKDILFTEDLELEASGYAQKSGENKLIFALNAFDQNTYVPKKYRSREYPFEIERGYTNEDEIEITIPDGFIIEAKPNGIEQKSEFGSYKIEFNAVSPNKIVCKRKLIVMKGLYDKSKYEDYRKFRETIAKNDNSKIVISKV